VKSYVDWSADIPIPILVRKDRRGADGYSIYFFVNNIGPEGPGACIILSVVPQLHRGSQRNGKLQPSPYILH
jgi:hypothetical protein